MSVLSVSLSPTHSFSKSPVSSITLIPNLGVQGDAHAGQTVQHLSRLHIKPPPPNLRQVHLIHCELLASVSTSSGSTTTGKPLQPGDLGENITTTGLELLALGKGTKLRFVVDDDGNMSGGEVAGAGAVVEVQGLRNPCPQIDKFQNGLKEKLVVRDANRAVVGRLAGIMGTVEAGGDIRPGMRIVVEKPAVYRKLECV
ncbi:hypothetical protein FQN50_006204 [Emmonsiellopsis sp. PD_5]|nr:hypothetical protein FQN50_006204 [Emmonsiellopsis sp. PD_5]